MKVLMFSTDPAVLIRGSDAHVRMKEYADMLGELHMVVLTRRDENGVYLRNLFLYPAASLTGALRLFHAWQIGRILCRRIRFDVISVQSPDEVGIIGLLLARRFRTPLQLQVHTDVYSPWYRRAGWKELLRYRIARFLIPRANCIRVVSKRIGHSLGRPGSAVLPIFTDIASFLSAVPDTRTRERFRNHAFKMISAGRFVEKEKHFLMPIEMMRHFVKICPTALLVLVGEGPGRKRYESLIRKYGLEKNVIIEPWRSDLASFYKSFDLFLLPSNYEGWGRAAIEAMAAGLAVVMTDVGLAGEVVEDGKNGRVVPVGDGAEFLAAVEDLYKNPEKRKVIAAAGQEAVVVLAPKTKEEYLALYKRSFFSCLTP